MVLSHRDIFGGIFIFRIKDRSLIWFSILGPKKSIFRIRDPGLLFEKIRYTLWELDIHVPVNKKGYTQKITISGKFQNFNRCDINKYWRCSRRYRDARHPVVPWRFAPRVMGNISFSKVLLSRAALYVIIRHTWKLAALIYKMMMMLMFLFRNVLMF